MNDYLENAKNIRAIQEEAASRAENERLLKEQEYYNTLDRIESLREAAIAKMEKRSNFSHSVIEHFLELALQNIYFKSFKESMVNETVKNLGSNLIHNYVTEYSASNLLNDFRGKSLLLSEVYRLVNKYYGIVMEGVDEDNDSTYEVTPEQDEKFYDELNDSVDVDDITNTIRLRVANAEEEFMQRNIQDKSAIQDIITQASNMVAATDNNDETEPELDDEEEQEGTGVDESSMLVNTYINDRKAKRPKNVFEQMVINMSESIIKDEDTRKIFIESADSDRLDMTKVVDAVRATYTMLEMMNSCKMKSFDENEIKDTLENL